MKLEELEEAIAVAGLSRTELHQELVRRGESPDVAAAAVQTLVEAWNAADGSRRELWKALERRGLPAATAVSVAAAMVEADPLTTSLVQMTEFVPWHGPPTTEGDGK